MRAPVLDYLCGNVFWLGVVFAVLYVGQGLLDLYLHRSHGSWIASGREAKLFGLFVFPRFELACLVMAMPGTVSTAAEMISKEKLLVNF